MTPEEVLAELVVTSFDVGEEDLLEVEQIRVSIFGDEFLLDPDQAEKLNAEIAIALQERE